MIYDDLCWWLMVIVGLYLVYHGVAYIWLIKAIPPSQVAAVRSSPHLRLHSAVHRSPQESLSGECPGDNSCGFDQNHRVVHLLELTYDHQTCPKKNMRSHLWTTQLHVVSYKMSKSFSIQSNNKHPKTTSPRCKSPKKKLWWQYEGASSSIADTSKTEQKWWETPPGGSKKGVCFCTSTYINPWFWDHQNFETCSKLCILNDLSCRL